MKARKVLITGAGIAGPCLAFWLNKFDFEVTLVEKAPALRLGGQNIDIRGDAIEVVKAMDLEPAIRTAFTTEQGLQFVNARGEVQGKFPRQGSDSFTAEYEILRGDLTTIFYDATRARADYRFGRSVAAIKNADDAVTVEFDHGKAETFDFLISAEGFASPTRELILGPGDYYRYLGLYTAYFTIPREPGDSNWATWYNAPGGKVILMRPDNKGTMRVSVFFLESHARTEHLSQVAAKAKVRDALAGAGWQSERIRSALEGDDDFYAGPLSQVKTPHWSRGRCALLGDSAYCPTPITGSGTSLAIVGAKILAEELHRGSDHRVAFRNYEAELRPRVARAQRLSPGVPRLVYPKSRAGIFLLNKAAWLYSKFRG